MNNTVSDIFFSKSKIKINFNCKTLLDALNFGFSYIESEDHVVEYIVANSKTIKNIFVEIPESAVKVNGDAIGELWTAKLLVSDKLSDSQILFSNSTFSVVVNLNLNKEINNGDI